MVKSEDRRFVVWDEREGRIPRDNGAISTGGVLGAAEGLANAYIGIYPRVLDGEPQCVDLEIGRGTRVAFSLSGTTGFYTIYRVA